MNVHIFNPEHDIALAVNSKFWTAPHAGRQLRADLGWLPVLWAESGDVVLVDDVVHAQNAYRKLRNNVPVVFVTIDGLANLIDEQSVICPWGWDISIVEQLARNNVPRSLLPSESILDKLRQLSGRQTSARLLKYLRDNNNSYVGDAHVLKSLDEVFRLQSEWGGVVLKAPWSSSGRGVKYLLEKNDNIIRWAEKVLRTQGHIMAERFLDKVMDFGMEFSIREDGEVVYDGLSLFQTTNGAYVGSVLATENEKTEILSRYISGTLLATVKHDICDWMKKEINGVYVGPFGVDMMICKNPGGTLALDPCVEINLRRTMGHVALTISPTESGMQDIMQIKYENGNYCFKILTDHEVLF